VSPHRRPRNARAGAGGLRALVVDDEAPARADLAWLLEREPSVGTVAVAGDANEALRTLQGEDTDVVFLDVRMPGLHGLDLARVLARFASPPAVVFVTAHEEHAVEAFELRARDYLLKPVRPERLREALARVPARAVAGAGRGGLTAHVETSAPDREREVGRHDHDRGHRQPARADRRADERTDELAVLTVESVGRTRFVDRDDVRYVEACGDYTRVHASDGGHLVRIPISVLEAHWGSAGFFRIHRGYLVALRAVSELRSTSGTGSVVVVDGRELPVSRRHAREFKEALVRSRAGGGGRAGNGGGGNGGGSGGAGGRPRP
jgi:two-component system, LytTR family, response regulator